MNYFEVGTQHLGEIVKLLVFQVWFYVFGKGMWELAQDSAPDFSVKALNIIVPYIIGLVASLLIASILYVVVFIAGYLIVLFSL